MLSAKELQLQPNQESLAGHAAGMAGMRHVDTADPAMGRTLQSLTWNTPNALQVRRPDRGILRCGHSDYYGDRCRATDLPIAGLNGFDSQETLQDRAPKIERESFGHVYIMAVNLRGHTVTSWSLTLTSVRRMRRRKQPD